MTGVRLGHVLADVDATVAGIASVRRGGLNKLEVYQVLRAAAEEVQAAWRDRNALLTENDRLKRALREWQTAQFEGAQGVHPQPRPLRDNELPHGPAAR